MEIGIFSSHVVWRIRHRKLRQEAKESGKSIDEILEENENRDLPSPDGVASASVNDLESQTPLPTDSKGDDLR